MKIVFAKHYGFKRRDFWDMTSEEMVHYARGALTHYKMDFQNHAMSEDAESSIRKQINELWDFMFPTSETYASNAKEQLQAVKDKYGID